MYLLRIFSLLMYHQPHSSGSIHAQAIMDQLVEMNDLYIAK